MKQNKDREEFEKKIEDFEDWYDDAESVDGRDKNRDILWNYFQSYTQKKVKEALNNILEENHCDLDGTYDYDGIAESVIELAKKK